MNKSDSIASLAAALSKAQGIMRPAVKDAVNPHLRSKYADLGAVWEACREPLSSNGLSVVQMPLTAEPGYVALETLLMHDSGEWVASTCQTRLVKDDPQGMGSAITYLKRYALSALLGIVADEDDDGAHASGQGGGQRQAPAARPAPAAQSQAARPQAQANRTLVQNGDQKLSAGQANSLHARLGAIFADTAYKGTDQKAWAGKFLKRPIESFTELTLQEASDLSSEARRLTGKTEDAA